MRTRAPRPTSRETDNNGWQDHAACTTSPYDADLWFPDSYRTSQGQAQALTAARICATCPVLQQCLAAAIANEGNLAEDRRNGIWGGTTPEQRFRLAKLGHSTNLWQVAA
jgi:WhiB family redox-sensing transcriptional regulator